MKELGILVILLVVWSCEKVIDLDLDSSEPQIVIEANVDDKSDTCFVLISKTNDYFSSEDQETVSGATIVLESDDTQYSYTERESGVYYLNKTAKFDSSEYTLTVTINGSIYEANSTMPAIVPIKLLAFEYKDKSLADDAGYIVSLCLEDPEEETNYYRVRYYLNGVLQNDTEDYTLFSDKYTNGNAIITDINTADRFEIGDTITVELMSIDENTYNYFTTFLDIIDGSTVMSTAPDNPNSNFSNDALGYFSAYSSDKKTIVIRENTGF